MLFANQDKRTVNLGLQGGGAHGAFTWGVLDYLLEDGRIHFDGISGTSAGAMNAVILSHGLMQGGRNGARDALASFWSAVAATLPFEMATVGTKGQSIALAPSLKALLQFTQHLSPEQFNPFDINPLRDILLDQVDFARLRKHSPIKLFIAAANARSGKVRIFRETDIEVKAVLASACLPTLHHTVEIDGQPYWDGGYAANPAVFPLFEECAARDILLILLTQREREDVPRTSEAIKEWAGELAFNATFLQEMRGFASLQKQAGSAWLRLGQLERRIARTRFHIIEPHDDMSLLRPDTKLAVSQEFFAMLRDLGRMQAQAWMVWNFSCVGKRSSVDLAELFY